jgi:hypothetical protein
MRDIFAVIALGRRKAGFLLEQSAMSAGKNLKKDIPILNPPENIPRG